MQDPVDKKQAHAIDLRTFVGTGELTLDGEVGSAVAEFYAMSQAISSKGFEAELENWIQPTDSLPGTELVARVADQLSHNLEGWDADILRKVIQEVMLDAAGVGCGAEHLNIKSGLEKFLRKRGARRLLELLLARYVFTTVWLRIEEAIRKKTGGQSLSKSMIGLERLCTATVRDVVDEWETEGKLEGLPTRKRLGSLLVKTIEGRLIAHPTYL
jgi:hypothetical protein